MAAKRSRTGCQTCRSRKLKCDEVRPRCGQCTKSRRDCVPSDGIAFRHEQNASMNAGASRKDKGLQNFFKYRNEFDAEQIRHFVPIPRDLKFVHIEDPFSEEQNPGNPPASPGSYQQVAAHSLEALSTAATDHPAFGDYNTAFTNNNNGRSGYGPAGSGLVASGIHGSNNQNNGINFLLNPSNIDPSLEGNLDAQIPHQDGNPVDTDLTESHQLQDSDKQDESEEARDMRLADLLRDAGATHEVTAA